MTGKLKAATGNPHLHLKVVRWQDTTGVCSLDRCQEDATHETDLIRPDTHVAHCGHLASAECKPASVDLGLWIHWPL